MKKSLAAAVLGCLALAVSVRAFWVYNATLVNDPAIAYSQNYVLNLNNTPNQAGIDSLSAQAVYSSATIAASSFNDGRVSTGAITVVNTNALTSANATNQITLAATSVILAASATNYLVVATTQSLTGKTITYNGNPIVGGTDWTIVATTSGTAANIATRLNRFVGLTAVRTGSTVNLTAAAGSAGNSKTLTVNTSSITLGGATFTGGHNARLANSYITVNGVQLFQGTSWAVADTSSGTATSIASVLNKISGIRAAAVGSVVYSTATTAGSAGNAFTLTSSQPSYMTVSNPTYAGGRDNARVTINGTALVRGTAWTQATTSSGTAKAISDAIMANSSLNTILSSTWSAAGVVTATSTLQGTSKNFTLTTNVPSYLTLSGATFTGGTNAAWAGGTSPITIASHGLTTGLGVVYSTGTGVTISPLVNGSTYYAAKISANVVALSTTAAGAIAGNYITLATPSTSGPHTFTLTPQTYTGTASMAWMGSNDGTNYNPIAISSLTITSPSGTQSVQWDFGPVTTKYMRLDVVAPTTGGLNLVVTVNGKNQ